MLSGQGTRVINFRPAASAERTAASFPVPFVPSRPSFCTSRAALFRLPRQRGTSNGDTLVRSDTFVIRLNPICPARRTCVKYAIAHLAALGKRMRARDSHRGTARPHSSCSISVCRQRSANYNEITIKRPLARFSFDVQALRVNPFAISRRDDFSKLELSPRLLRMSLVRRLDPAGSRFVKTEDCCDTKLACG